MEDRDATQYSLGHEYTAESCYNDDTSRRQSVIDMGRLMAELTIPSVFPPEGYMVGEDLPGNNQSISALAVNTLTSTLMFMAFPPGQPIMRLKPVEYKLQAEINQDPELYANTLLALSRLELEHREIIQTTPLATAYTGYVKLLLVAGNALWKHLTLQEPTYHLPTTYTVKRNSAGHPLRTIHKECMTFDTLDEDWKEQIRDLLDETETQKDGKALKEFEIEVDIYSVCKLKTSGDGERTWLFWQEYKGIVLEGTGLEADYDNPPMWPGWLIPVYGQNWGRSYCEEYRGDLYTLEAHASAINDGASLAALSLIFVKPGATSIKTIREARNLSTVSGDGNDVSVFRTDKTGDFSFVMSNYEAVAKRVSAAFLMQSSVQRSGERVTAEEIRRLGNELDKAMGGTYTYMAQGNQKVIIVRAVNLVEAENPGLPEIPRDVVKVEVITGIDAMGQSTEYDNLMEYAEAGLKVFPDKFQQSHDASNFFMRAAAAKGVKPDGLVLKPEQIAANDEQAKQQSMQQTMLDKGTGPAVKGMADFLGQQGGGAEAPPTLQ